MGHANAAHLSACPFRGCRTARCLLHTHPHLCRELEGLSLVSRSHTCLCVCASNVRAPVRLCAATFPRRALGLSYLLSPLPFSPPPAHLCVVFLAPLPPPLPFSATTSPARSVLRAQTVAGVRAESALRGDAADATAVWSPCLLLGPLRRTRLHVSWGV